MKTNFLIIILMVTALAATAQKKTTKSTSAPKNWGLGLRIGDPSGITAKKYLLGGRALEFNLGRSTYLGFDYRDNFYDRDKYSGYDYLDSDAKSSITFQARYIFQKDFPGVKGLQWYWGLGPQLRFKSYEFYYRFRDYFGPNPDDYNWVYDRDKVTDIDFGADALIGLEYQFPDAPLSIFVDVNILVELLDNPFLFYGQGGVGIRYNFK